MTFRDMLKEKVANVVVYGGTGLVLIVASVFIAEYFYDRAKEQAKETVSQTYQEGKQVVTNTTNALIKKGDETAGKVKELKDKASVAVHEATADIDVNTLKDGATEKAVMLKDTAKAGIEDAKNYFSTLGKK